MESLQNKWLDFQASFSLLVPDSLSQNRSSEVLLQKNWIVPDKWLTCPVILGALKRKRPAFPWSRYRENQMIDKPHPPANTEPWIRFLVPPCFSFFKKLFIYLFMAALGLHCCRRAFFSCADFVAVHGLLIVVASLVAEHRLQACGLQ